MGVWVVILEAVAAEPDRSGLGIEPGALDDLADELASNYAVVTELPGAYETELWIEEGTAGAAVLAAQRLCQAAVRYLGLPAWEVVRAEARNALALETGAIDWPDPPVAAGMVDELDSAPPPPAIELEAPPAPVEQPPAKKAAAKKAAAKKPGARKAARAPATKARAPAKAARKAAAGKKPAAAAAKAPARKARRGPARA